MSSEHNGILMNLDDIEDKIIGHEIEYEYDHTRWGGEKGTNTYELDWHELWHNDPKERIEIPDLGTLRVVESFGGEGEGDSAWVVVGITDDDGTERLFRKDGWYASFNGAEFDGDFREVRATEKTITVYEENA